VVVFILLYIIFILYHRKVGIIRDTGFYKILILSIGTIIYSLSITFITYKTNLECTFNLILKHTGISMVLYVFYIYITLSYIFGYLGSKNIEATIIIKEKKAYAILNEATFIYILYLIAIFAVGLNNLIKYNNELDVIQNDEYWVYQCNLNKADFVFNIMTFMFSFIMLLRGRKTILKYNIFNCVKYIIISLLLILTLGPLINVNKFILIFFIEKI